VDIQTVEAKGKTIAIVHSKEMLIKDVQSALDLMMTVHYETGSDRIILPKSAVCEDFFDLKTRLAGEVLQKFVNYQRKLAIVGDASSYSSRSLRDFIYESNQGKSIFFVAGEKQAVEKLSMDWTTANNSAPSTPLGFQVMDIPRAGTLAVALSQILSPVDTLVMG